MPKKYIDADYVIKAIGADNSCVECKQSRYDCLCQSLSRADICGIIDDAPTSDLATLKHGKWMHDSTGANFCSECGMYPYDDGEYHMVWHADFCPNCGAKMDGDTDGV